MWVFGTIWPGVGAVPSPQSTTAVCVSSRSASVKGALTVTGVPTDTALLGTVTAPTTGAALVRDSPTTTGSWSEMRNSSGA